MAAPPIINNGLGTVQDNNYQWVDKGTGVDYFLNDAPINREQYASGTGRDVGAIEAFAAKYGGTPAVVNSTPTYDAAARQNWMSDRDNKMTGIANMVNRQTTDMNRAARNYYVEAQQGQQALNQKGMQNELARIQGRGGILARVGDQTKSAGVMLGQKNAGNSSAAQALANAYGELGNRDVQKVEQGYAVNNEGINAEQQIFDTKNQNQVKDFEEDKLNNINAIVEQAARDLQALNDAAANASLPERIALENEKARIRSEATSKLGQFDSQVAAARGLKGSDSATRRTQANQMNQAGSGASMFNLTPERDMQMQYQGETQAGGNLPIYQMPRKRY